MAEPEKLYIVRGRWPMEDHGYVLDVYHDGLDWTAEFTDDREKAIRKPIAFWNEPLADNCSPLYGGALEDA